MKQTSLHAYEQVKPVIPTHEKLICQMLSNGNYTSQQIAEQCSLDYHQVARRIGKLQVMGLVAESGNFGISPKGRKAIIWSKKL